MRWRSVPLEYHTGREFSSLEDGKYLLLCPFGSQVYHRHASYDRIQLGTGESHIGFPSYESMTCDDEFRTIIRTVASDLAERGRFQTCGSPLRRRAVPKVGNDAFPTCSPTTTVAAPSMHACQSLRRYTTVRTRMQSSKGLTVGAGRRRARGAQHMVPKV